LTDGNHPDSLINRDGGWVNASYAKLFYDDNIKHGLFLSYYGDLFKSKPEIKVSSGRICDDVI